MWPGATNSVTLGSKVGGCAIRPDDLAERGARLLISSPPRIALFLVVAVAITGAVFWHESGPACAALPPEAIQALKDNAEYSVLIDVAAIDCIKGGEYRDDCRMQARIIEILRQQEPLVDDRSISILIDCWPAQGKDSFVGLGPQYVLYGGAMPGRLLMWMNSGDEEYFASVWE